MEDCKDEAAAIKKAGGLERGLPRVMKFLKETGVKR
jgi:hypothetical protein